LPQRGTKRKGAFDLGESDEAETEPSPPPASSPASSVPPEGVHARGKRGVVLDSDEEEMKARPTRSKGLSAAERAVADMMDVDDGEYFK